MKRLPVDLVLFGGLRKNDIRHIKISMSTYIYIEYRYINGYSEGAVALHMPVRPQVETSGGGGGGGQPGVAEHVSRGSVRRGQLLSGVASRAAWPRCCSSACFPLRWAACARRGS